MNPDSRIVESDTLNWETWLPEQQTDRGNVFWKTIISSDRTVSQDLTLGLAVIPPGEALHPHQHDQSEVYYILEGTGVMFLGKNEHAVKTGTAIYMPGNALHSLKNTGSKPLQFLYVFAADSFADITYRFNSQAQSNS
ncbi:MAG: cupin domain-containing protein [Symploca sp. SIO1C4]|uniref:Cupin domain-containing protein n=1 Tax=Symploca sp. SIO1C4 TaxID=2607765 RepID=A0A6B3NF63_9CYAN|nr:cupin domain-containing protein [Symploca sp. SIO1C4]